MQCPDQGGGLLKADAGNFCHRRDVGQGVVQPVEVGGGFVHRHREHVADVHYLVIRELKRGFHAGKQRGVLLHCATVGERHIQCGGRRRENRIFIPARFSDNDLRGGRIIRRGGGVVAELARLVAQRLHFRRLFFHAEHGLKLGVFLRKLIAGSHQRRAGYNAGRRHPHGSGACTGGTAGKLLAFLVARFNRVQLFLLRTDAGQRLALPGKLRRGFADAGFKTLLTGGQVAGINPGFPEFVFLARDRLAQAVVFGLERLRRAFRGFHRPALRQRRLLGVPELRRQRFRFRLRFLKRLPGHCKLRAGLAKAVNFPGLRVELAQGFLRAANFTRERFARRLDVLKRARCLVYRLQKDL
ncbi:hypothetical protein BN135_3851 [Cronobacter muytjensii 530]